jgi:tRNA (guanine37-N1)-methyltransferase
MAVPEVLLSGDHERVAQWRRRQSVERTLAARPDLADARLSRNHEGTHGLAQTDPRQ